ncbi:MAG TPA: cyclic nucleotide-binding domain-containing protein [Polyangiaceae bacterium]|nr:cyclic nucleotide-binding domain-containing protein [Polyangiaceae bacterium]
MRELEEVIAQLTLFEHLRADEIGRIASRFHVETLAAGATRTFDATPEGSRLVVAVRGHLSIEVEAAATTLRSRLEPGDRHGEVALLTRIPRVVRATALEGRDAVLATVDREGLDAILDEFPAAALPLATELASELRSRQDVARQLLELHAERLPDEELRAAVDERRRALARRGARVVRTGPRAMFRRLVVEQGAEPPFWMLVGFIVSLGLARLTVFLILHFHLEQQLFALVKSPTDPNPMHVHHFNYGLVLIGLSGLDALVLLGRRALRGLALTFGFGCGLVFDEFAIFWNLNPEYAQTASVVAAAIAAAVLVQLVWFRRFWGAVMRRAVLTMRGAR